MNNEYTNGGNVNRGFVIVAEVDGVQLVWNGGTGLLARGWYSLTVDKTAINRVHRYYTRLLADSAIVRNRYRYPFNRRWQAAKYLTLDEAHADDNPLGIDWSA